MPACFCSEQWKFDRGEKFVWFAPYVDGPPG